MGRSGGGGGVRGPVPAPAGSRGSASECGLKTENAYGAGAGLGVGVCGGGGGRVVGTATWSRAFVWQRVAALASTAAFDLLSHDFQLYLWSLSSRCRRIAAIMTHDRDRQSALTEGL